MAPCMTALTRTGCFPLDRPRFRAFFALRARLVAERMSPLHLVARERKLVIKASPDGSALAPTTQAGHRHPKHCFHRYLRSIESRLFSCGLPGSRVTPWLVGVDDGCEPRGRRVLQPSTTMFFT